MMPPRHRIVITMAQQEYRRQKTAIPVCQAEKAANCPLIADQGSTRPRRSFGSSTFEPRPSVVGLSIRAEDVFLVWRVTYKVLIVMVILKHRISRGKNLGNHDHDSNA